MRVRSLLLHAGLAPLAVGLCLISTTAGAAEPDEAATDDERAPSADDESAPTPEPDETADDGGKAKKPKKPRKARQAGKPATDDPELPPERTSGARARQIERSKPWIRRWVPERDMLDVGIAIGGFFLPKDHGLFDAGLGPRPSYARSAFLFDFRLAYMILPYVGVGLETGVSPNHSTTARADATMPSFRMHVIGQLPYRITPTLVLGGGFVASRSNEPILRELDSAFHWGPGVKLFINQWVSARIDGRHIVTPSGSDGGRASYGELLFGIDINLRMRRLVKPRPTGDRDGDGWLDRYDRCPTEPSDEPDGCPRDRDSDKDGVPDRIDACPEVWGDGAKGCPIPDQDDDGIYDKDDNCIDQPETRNGFEDGDGCPDEAPAEVKQLTGVIEGITFDSGKITIRKSSRPILDKVVATMKSYPELRIEITGHTDDQGPRDTNVELSGKRADAVRAYLVAKGIDGKRITTKGAGPDQPIADNGSKAGRARNRRIEFKVVP